MVATLAYFPDRISTEFNLYGLMDVTKAGLDEIFRIQQSLVPYPAFRTRKQLCAPTRLCRRNQVEHPSHHQWLQTCQGSKVSPYFTDNPGRREVRTIPRLATTRHASVFVPKEGASGKYSMRDDEFLSM